MKEAGGVTGSGQKHYRLLTISDENTSLVEPTLLQPLGAFPIWACVLSMSIAITVRYHYHVEQSALARV